MKHWRRKRLLEIIKQNEMIIPEWLLQEPVEKKTKKICNPKLFRQLAPDNIKLDDKQLNKELTKKMIYPNSFTDRNFKVGFNISPSYYSRKL